MTCSMLPPTKASPMLVGMMSSEKVDPADVLRGGGMQFQRASVHSSAGGVDVHAGAGTEQVDGDKAEQQRERRDDLEIDEGLDADAADLLQVAHARDADDDATEDDGRERHANEANESVA